MPRDVQDPYEPAFEPSIYGADTLRHGRREGRGLLPRAFELLVTFALLGMLAIIAAEHTKRQACQAADWAREAAVVTMEAPDCGAGRAPAPRKLPQPGLDLAEDTRRTGTGDQNS